ncbi:MAG: membrane dipeptidase [Cyclobacteriaceae bacterium]
MEYFDLHCHPSFKPFLSAEKPNQKKNCWDPLPNVIPIVESQSSLDQVKKGKVKLAVAGIYAMERGFSSAFIIKHIAPLVSILDKQFIDNMNSYHYHDLLQDEIAFFMKNRNINGNEFRVLDKITDLQDDKLNIILSIEGGHALDGKKSVLENLVAFKKQSPRILYLTLTHLTQYDLSTHAYGMKMIKADVFKPKGLGITAAGLKVIDTCYDSNIGKRIFVDIKHMSLVSRLQFYKYRQEKGFNTIPIIASHCAVAGTSYKGLNKYFKNKPIQQGDYIQVKLKRPKGIGKTNFNPWTINLFDEEIPIILGSGGLIGISLDQRILGSNNVKGEFFSKEEFTHLNQHWQSTIRSAAFEDDDEIEFDQELQRPKDIRLNVRKHLRHLTNTILHFVKIGGPKTWKHLCLGSDYDGLIDAVNNCLCINEYPNLEKDLVKMIPKSVKKAKQTDPTIDFHITDIKQQVRDIMYNNAFNFLQKNFQ